MDFFGVGLGEILLILILALIIWGPGRAIEVGNTLGRMVRSLRRMTADLTAQVISETEEPEKKHLPPQPDEREPLGKPGISRK